MPKTDAQRRAQKVYADKHKGEYKVFQTGFKVDEAERIEAALSTANVSKADLIRRAAARIEQGDDLRRKYDAETDSLKPLEE